MAYSKEDPGFRNSASPLDTWESGNSYDLFMGRWSRLAAHAFIDWLSPPPGMIWLDIGCGSGALSRSVIDRCKPDGLVAVDRSYGFVKSLQNKLNRLGFCQVGDAVALPIKNNSVHISVSGLVLNFIGAPSVALSEMKRVTAPGGTVAFYVWDYSGKMDFLNKFWDAAVAVDSKALTLHESLRFPDSNSVALHRLFEKAGFANIESTPLDIKTHFKDFDDYWNPFLGGQGPAPSYLMSLDEGLRAKIKDRLLESLPIQNDGSILMDARAWALRGSVGS